MRSIGIPFAVGYSRTVATTFSACLLTSSLGGPADEFPAKFLLFFSRAKIRLRETPRKIAKKVTDGRLTEAPFPPPLIFSHRAPPPPTEQFVISVHWNPQFWRRHGITHIVRNAVTSPESALT